MVKITKYDVQLIKESTKMYDFKDKNIGSTKAAADHIRTITEIYNSTVEKFGMLCLDAQNNIVGIHIVSIGVLSETIVDMRSIFQRAILNNACKIIIFHNHPGGSSKPSIQDIDLTERIKNASKIMGIPLLDHIIIYGEEEFSHISFAEEGLM